MKLIYGLYLCRYSFAIKITFTSNGLWDIDYTFLHCSRLPVDQSFPLKRLHCSHQTGSCQLLDPLSPSTRMCFQTHYMLDSTPCRMSLKDSFLEKRLVFTALIHQQLSPQPHYAGSTPSVGCGCICM